MKIYQFSFLLSKWCQLNQRKKYLFLKTFEKQGKLLTSKITEITEKRLNKSPNKQTIFIEEKKTIRRFKDFMDAMTYLSGIFEEINTENFPLLLAKRKGLSQACLSLPVPLHCSENRNPICKITGKLLYLLFV